MAEKKQAIFFNDDSWRFPVLYPEFAGELLAGRALDAKKCCIGCGKCALSCPVNGIDIAERRPHWNGACTHCMACICGCPVSAIEYGHKSQGKPRYQCPEYK